MSEAPQAPGPDPARTYAVSVLGCKVNQYEARQAASMLDRAGLAPAPPGTSPDVLVLHTCAVTGEAARQSAQALRRARRAHPAARIVLSGCAAEPGLLEPPRDVPSVAPGPGWAAAFDAVLDTLPLPGPRGTRTAAGGGPALERFTGQTRAYLKIQDGCDLSCAYCIVPSLRKGPRDKPLRALLDEARALADHGHAELVVTGVCVGLYGRRGPGTPPLSRVMRELAAIPAVHRLRLSSLHPAELTPDLLAAWSETPKIAPHAHLPLQSGSDRILRAMRRGYTADAFLRAADRLRAALDRPALSTDVIAGFPGETGEDHAATERVCRAAGFSRLHVFPFSARPGTAAADRPDAVAPSEVRDRARRLRDLGGRLAAAFHGAFAGDTLEVLVERVGEDGTAAGYSARYLPVRFPAGGARAGSFVRVRVTASGAEGLTAACAS